MAVPLPALARPAASFQGMKTSAVLGAAQLCLPEHLPPQADFFFWQTLLNPGLDVKKSAVTQYRCGSEGRDSVRSTATTRITSQTNVGVSHNVCDRDCVKLMIFKVA